MATDTETFTVTVLARDLAAPQGLAASSRLLEDPSLSIPDVHPGMR